MNTLARCARLSLPLVLAAWIAPESPPAAAPTAPAFTHPTTIDNALAPFAPGAVKVYTGRTHGAALVIVELHLADTRVFDVGGTPVECVTLQETEFEDGAIAEVSRNYLAQADDGVVYCFGEIADNYEDGVIVSHEGSWLVGGPTQAADAADMATALQPSVLMPAAPAVGDSWKPDDLPPIADETAVVVTTHAQVKVRAGKFESVVMVKETSDLEDAETERKWYAPDVGLVKSQAHGEKLQLVSTML